MRLKLFACTILLLYLAGLSAANTSEPSVILRCEGIEVAKFENSIVHIDWYVEIFADAASSEGYARIDGRLFSLQATNTHLVLTSPIETTSAVNGADIAQARYVRIDRVDGSYIWVDYVDAGDGRLYPTPRHYSDPDGSGCIPVQRKF